MFKNNSTHELPDYINYLYLLMENASDIFLIFDEEMKLIYCSSNFLDELRLKDFSEILGKPVEFIHNKNPDKEYVKRSLNRISRIKSKETRIDEDDVMNVPNKGKRSYRITYRRILGDDNDCFDGVIIILKDVTELRLEEAELRMNDMLYSTLLPCVVWDEKGDVVAYNNEAAAVFGVPAHLTPEEFNKSLSSLRPKYQPDGNLTEKRRKESIREALSNGFSHIEVQMKNIDGTPIYFNVSIARITWNYEYRLVVYYYDLTDIKVIEDEANKAIAQSRMLELQKEAAQAASDAKSQFLANMSHEIRTPMNAVLGMAEMLLSENLSPYQRRYVEDIKISAMSLLDIINDILDLSKIQSGKLNLIPVHYDFNELIENISSMARFLVKNKNLVYKFVILGDIPQCLYGDDLRLRQVLTNILSNAIKFTDEGYVRLTICTTDTSVRFDIEDTGIGIKSDDLPKLFEVFTQADPLKNYGKKGTGLGLSIVKALVEMMDGKITVDSVYGRGTIFHVMIPKILGDKTKIKHPDENERIIYAPEAKILVVDDNSINLNVASGLLRLCKISADTSLSGADAIELVQQNQYDIIFMDHMMPEMDGIQTTKIIRKMGIKVPIIALSANAVAGIKDKFINAGMNDFLSKPINRVALKQILVDWLPADKLIIQPSEIIAAYVTGRINDDENIYENESTSEMKMWKKIEQIEEISINAGLDRVFGQRDVLEKSLKLTIKEIDNCDNKLNKYLVEKNMYDFSIITHGMKGSLANIGAMDLSAKALDLEKASEKNDYDFCVLNLPDFLKGLNNLKTGLKKAFDEKNYENHGLPFEIPEELPLIFEKMSEAFDKMDFTVIDERIKEIDDLKLSGRLKEEIEQIKDAVLVMDYEEAKIIMQKLLNGI